MTGEFIAACALNGLLYTLVAFTTGCACLCSCFNRSKMRKQYKLEGNDCKDCLAHYFCEACALCQEYRELKNRGFDMTLGNPTLSQLTVCFCFLGE